MKEYIKGVCVDCQPVEMRSDDGGNSVYYEAFVQFGFGLVKVTSGKPIPMGDGSYCIRPKNRDSNVAKVAYCPVTDQLLLKRQGARGYTRARSTAFIERWFSMNSYVLYKYIKYIAMMVLSGVGLLTLKNRKQRGVAGILPRCEGYRKTEGLKVGEILLPTKERKKNMDAQDVYHFERDFNGKFISSKLTYTGSLNNYVKYLMRKYYLDKDMAISVALGDFLRISNSEVEMSLLDYSNKYTSVELQVIKMRYGNTIVREYPNYTNVSVFNFNIVDETKFQCRNTEKHKDSTEDEKRRIALLRARHKIFDIALLNDWEYFCTFTFNDQIVNARDYQNSIEKVKRWTQNNVKRKGLKYLLVPELHPTSGRVHLHGLLAYEFSPALQATGYHDKASRPIYNLPSWSYGFSTIIRIDGNSQDRIAKYITKYITKDLDKITGNYYYAGGKDLKRECEKYYINLNYDEFEGYETIINDKMKVKYSLVDKSSSAYLGYEKYNDGL